MQNNHDSEAVKITEKNAVEKPAEKPVGKAASAPKKKKNIIQVFRPQNSKTGMVKPGGRPKPQGQAGSRPQKAASGVRTQDGTVMRAPAGTRPAGARPAGASAAGSKPQNAAGTQAGSRPNTTQSTPAGSQPQGTAAQMRTQGTAGAAAPVKPQTMKNEMPAAAKPQGAAAEATATAKQQNMSGDVAAVAKPKSTTPDTAANGKPQGAPSGTAADTPSDGRTQGAVKTANSGSRSPQDASGSREAQSTGGRSGQSGARRNPEGRASGNRSQDDRRRTDNGRSNTRTSGGQDGRSSQGGRGSQSGNDRYAASGNRSQDDRRRTDSGRNTSRFGGSQDGRGSQSGYNRNQDGRGGQGSYSRNQDGRSGQGSYGRNSDGRGGQGGYSRNQDGRSGQGSYGRNTDGRGGQGGYNRNQDGRGGLSIPKPQTDSKPLEKESRKRTERGDRNRSNKGEKLDRMEKNVRPGQKNNQRNNQKNTARKGQPVKPAPQPAPKPAETIRTITLPDKMTISELAEAMKVQASAIVKKLFLQGQMVTVNQEVDFDKAEEIALEFNCICEKEEKVDVIAELLKEEEESEDVMIARPPVVCVMGHVDHGKTSLLDTIRHTHVIDKEAGGITQHIGAYVVSINGQKITFLDTPGHEAFTAMRMRGANATDIAILVVAADDGVMPQTVEAINHAKAAGIEIIVAINKIDKPSANIERVKQELSEYELIPEDWGGSTVMVPVSAHTHEGIDNLLEMILLTAEVLELKANPNRKARGLVIEAELDKGKGPVATVLVQKGTLHVGDPIAAGSCHGKVRAMMDDKGRRVKEAGPSTPVEILGLSDVPNAGEIFISMDNEKEARSFAETFISEGRERLIEDTKLRMSLDDLYSQIQAGKLKELDLIVKADVQGSVEAVKQSLLKLSNEEVVVKVIHSGVGAINESDVILASASNAIIIGFNIRPDAMAKATAERENVDIRLYRVIYDAIADVEAAMKGMLDPIFEEKVIGHAEIRQLFRASGVGTIAGSYVLDGVFQRGCKVRITRDDTQIYDGALASLKRFKDDVKEVKAGYECGFVFEKFNEIKEEDKVEAYIMVEVPR
ncbi:MAG: translation initiation factor IF-2 [Lachnospiraceae bacterium]|nr:translation initiation factor IF-2 [Lachnospiraceae bacterium]